jgi:pilus assembly protein Flp/PilA
MRLFAHGLACLLQSEGGSTADEFAVVLALIVGICLVATQTLGSNANNKFSNVALNAAAGSSS